MTETKNEVAVVEKDVVETVEVNYFAELASIDVSQLTKKKGKFDYLSWPVATKILKLKHPDAKIEVREWIDADGGPNPVPYLKVLGGYMVQVYVTINGKTEGKPFAVTGNNNVPIKTPTVHDINTSIQRAMVKAIAEHGLGLHVYAGEDFPNTDVPESAAPKAEPVTQAPPVMTPMQQDQIKNLAAQIAKLTCPQGSTNDVLNARYKQITAQFYIHPNLTPEAADAIIGRLVTEVQTIQANQMVAQPEPDEDPFA